MHAALEPTRQSDWVLSHEGYNVLSGSAVESRFALGNGFLGMRAARSVSRDPTWVAWLGYIRWASWPRCVRGQLLEIEIGLDKVEYALCEGECLAIRDETEDVQLTREHPVAVRLVSMR